MCEDGVVRRPGVGLGVTNTRLGSRVALVECERSVPDSDGACNPSARLRVYPKDEEASADGDCEHFDSFEELLRSL